MVPRGFPVVLTSPTTPQANRSQSGRLELATWIASKDNPLTARVMVNRIWQHLIGVGIVESCDDFGKTGQTPANAALLDHLAQRFIAGGWSVKQLISEITNSRVYQLGTAHDAQAYEVDPANRLNWRANRRRLDARGIGKKQFSLNAQRSRWRNDTVSKTQILYFGRHAGKCEGRRGKCGVRGCALCAPSEGSAQHSRWKLSLTL